MKEHGVQERQKNASTIQRRIRKSCLILTTPCNDHCLSLWHHNQHFSLFGTALGTFLWCPCPWWRNCLYNRASLGLYTLLLGREMRLGLPFSSSFLPCTVCFPFLLMLWNGYSYGVVLFFRNDMISHLPRKPGFFFDMVIIHLQPFCFVVPSWFIVLPILCIDQKFPHEKFHFWATL